MRHSITHNVANSATKLQIKCRIAKENPKITHILRRYLQQTAKKCLLYSIVYYLFFEVQSARDKSNYNNYNNYSKNGHTRCASFLDS